MTLRRSAGRVTAGVFAAAVVVVTAVGAQQGGGRDDDLRLPPVAAGEPSTPVAVVPVGPAELTSREVVEVPLGASIGWVAQVSAATGIGARALQAYADATLALDRDQPGCRVGWTTLAAIGAVESGHGTHGGAVLLADGRPNIPIVGPQLDGGAGTAAIPAGPDDTAWHGDAVWSHAVGPLQFLPSTWRRWASDGDGDGLADPNDLDDAAFAAARYLCASGADLTGAAGWWSAVLSYNHDESYAASVLAIADTYAAAAGG